MKAKIFKNKVFKVDIKEEDKHFFALGVRLMETSNTLYSFYLGGRFYKERRKTRRLIILFFKTNYHEHPFFPVSFSLVKSELFVIYSQSATI